MTAIAGGITMRKLIALFAIALVSCLSAYAAHSVRAQLLQSTPADGSVSDKPPAAFVFEFSEAVRFHEVFIKKDGDKEKPLHDVPYIDAKTIRVPAPALAAGRYLLEWQVFTHDSTVLSGQIRFSVSADSAVASSSPQ
jgi:methionine-rich copper-binding protein CopC